MRQILVISVGEVMLMGQLGTGDTANVLMDSSSILSGGEFDSNLSDYVKVVTGGDATCGIKSDGLLLCWGVSSGSTDKLGMGNNSASYVTTHIGMI